MSFQDIRRRSKKWLSAEEVGFLALVVSILAGLLLLNIALARTLRVPGGEWLFMRWSGARAFLIEGIEPYSTTIAERVQEVAYGRPAFSSEYAYVLNDPFYIVLLYTPLAILPEFASLLFPSLASVDFAPSRGIWMLCSEVALIGIVVLSLRLTEWEPPRWMLVCLFGFGLFSYFNLQALVSNSPTILLAFLYLAILLVLRSFNDELAGALLFLTAYQWEAGGLFFLFILFFVIANKRWNVFTGFGMSLVVFLLVSFLVYPGWGLPYIRAVLSDWYRSANLNLEAIISVWFPDSRFSIGTVTSLILAIILFFEWLGAVNPGRLLPISREADEINAYYRRVVWTASLSLAATPLMGFPIFPPNHVVLTLPFILILTLVWERWTRNRVWVSAFILILVVFIPYAIRFEVLFAFGSLYSNLLAVLPPVAAIIGLYWMRWWVLHSPRTWFDQIENSR